MAIYVWRMAPINCMWEGYRMAFALVEVGPHSTARNQRNFPQLTAGMCIWVMVVGSFVYVLRTSVSRP